MNPPEFILVSDNDSTIVKSSTVLQEVHDMRKVVEQCGGAATVFASLDDAVLRNLYEIGLLALTRWKLALTTDWDRAADAKVTEEISTIDGLLTEIGKYRVVAK